MRNLLLSHWSVSGQGSSSNVFELVPGLLLAYFPYLKVAFSANRAAHLPAGVAPCVAVMVPGCLVDYPSFSSILLGYSTYLRHAGSVSEGCSSNAEEGAENLF